MLMRKTILLLIGAMLMLTGCDFFRVLAGRPTSKDIENKRTEIRMAEEAAEQARLDSIAKAEEAVRKAAQDSVDAVTFIAENKVTLYTVAGLKGVAQDEIPSDAPGRRYRVIVGSFRELANAQAMKVKISDAQGCMPHLIAFNNGMVAVGVYPSDQIGNAVKGLVDIKKHPACPSDAWILKFD